jgi:signal transduction histidine kinase
MLLVQLVVFLLGAIDYATGVKFQFAIVYLAPISFAALRGGLRCGVVTSATSAAVWIVAEKYGGADFGNGWAAWWNALERFVGFSVMAVFLARSYELNQRLAEKANSLALEIEKRKRTEKVYVDEKEILQSIAYAGPLKEILEALARKIEHWYEGMLCCVFLFDGENNRFSQLIAPTLPKDFRRQIQQKPLDETLPNGGGTSLAAGLLHADVLAAPGWEAFRQIAAEHALCPCCSKPVLSATGELLGILTLFAYHSDPVLLSDLTLFDKALDIASIAIERARLNKELRKLSELVIDAQEAERRRIAADLHDSVNQLLSTVTFRIGMIAEQMSEAKQDMTAELEKAKMLLNKGIEEIHRISEGLRPSELDALGLAAAVRSLCREFQEKTKLPLKFELELSSKRLSDAVELTLYRIIQEALTNIEKHSGASHATLKLKENGTCLNMIIHDNGKGLAPASERPKPSRKTGMGLLNMRERTAFLGGTFSIHSTTEKGTEIMVRIPLAEPTQKTEANL